MTHVPPDFCKRSVTFAVPRHGVPTLGTKLVVQVHDVAADGGDVTVQADMATSRQLRTGSAPNAWEVGWLLWHYTDNEHFYYVILKPNGWEIGKEDPAYPGAQRFLASSSSPQFPLGPWYRVRVVQSGGTIQLFVNDLLIATAFDNDSPYTGGRVGLYTEDAESYFDNITITSVAKGRKKH